MNFKKILHYFLVPFIWIGKILKHAFVKIGIFCKRLFIVCYKILSRVALFFWYNKTKILLILLFFALLICPIFLINHLFEIGNLKGDDWGNVVGGCLGYYGTIILGLVAIIQTQISLKQNADTFIADKYSSLDILGQCSFQSIENNEVAYHNRHTYPVNQYYVNLSNSFQFDEKLKFLKLKMFYKSTNYPINTINLKRITGNYKDIYYIDNSVKTDLCENPCKGCGQLEIVFMLTESELHSYNKLFNEGQLIFAFDFEIISSFNVIMNESIEVNFSSLEYQQGNIEFSEQEQEWTIDTTSYKYNKGNKLWKKKKISKVCDGLISKQSGKTICSVTGNNALNEGLNVSQLSSNIATVKMDDKTFGLNVQQSNIKIQNIGDKGNGK